MKPTPLFLCALTLALALAGCGSGSDQPAASPGDGSGGPLQVSPVNYPLQYFAERIGGDAIEVVFPVPGDEDPAFWKPGDEDIAAFQQADLILLNGADYAKWRAAVSLPESKLIDTSRAFADQQIPIMGAGTHSHGKDGEHAHSGTATTTWIDFDLARQQALAIKNALVSKMPSQSEAFDAAFAALEEDLANLDREMKATAAKIGQPPLLSSHPVYQYRARRYGCKVQPLLWESETVPDNFAMEELKSLLEMHPAQAMLWESAPPAEAVAKLKAEGLQSVVFDPCANVPENGDWLSVMRENIANLAAIR